MKQIVQRVQYPLLHHGGKKSFLDLTILIKTKTLTLQSKVLLCILVAFAVTTNGMPLNGSANLKNDDLMALNGVPEFLLAVLKETDPQLALKILPEIMGKDNIRLNRREAKAWRNQRRNQHQQQQNQQRQELDEFGNPKEDNVFRLY